MIQRNCNYLEVGHYLQDYLLTVDVINPRFTIISIGGLKAPFGRRGIGGLKAPFGRRGIGGLKVGEV